MNLIASGWVKMARLAALWVGFFVGSTLVAVGQQPIACGQTIVTNISAASETDAYRFSGSAGQRAIIAVRDTGYDDYFNPSLDVYGPAGNYITSVTEGAIGVLLTNAGTHNIYHPGS